MAAVTVPAPEALLLQLGALTGNEPKGSYLEVRCLRPDGQPGRREFVGVRQLRRAVDGAV